MQKLENYQDLFEAGAIIKNKLREIELEVESVQAQVEADTASKLIAEEELSKTSISAVKDGLMGNRESFEGEYVTPQIKVGSLLDISEVFIEVGIVERDVPKVRLKQKARVFVDAYPRKAFRGMVERIYPTVEGKSRTLTVKIKVDNQSKKLIPGMFGRCEISVFELKRAYMVPSISLVKAGRGRYLLPVIPQRKLEEEDEGSFLGTVELRNVDVGYVTSDYAQIKDRFLMDGDLIVTEIQGNLANGIKVRVIGTEEFQN